MFGFRKTTPTAPQAAATARAPAVTATADSFADALTVSQSAISNEAELVQAVTFERSLAGELNLSPALLQHICPLETARHSRKVIILVSSRHRSSAELAETVRLLRQAKYSLDGPGRANVFVVLNEPLIHAVAKGQLDGQTASRMRVTYGDAAKSGYYQSFLDIISYGVQHKASDVHLNIFSQQERSEVRYTIDGKYVAPERFKLPTSALIAIARVAYQRSDGGNGPEFNGLIEQQCRIYVTLPNQAGSYMLRWASMACDEGPQITMRITRTDLDFKAMSLSELGYLPSQIEMFERVMQSEGGAIIFSGIVNSGKSTSLTSLLAQTPSTRKVITIEDPVENILPGAHFHQNTVSRRLDSDEDPFKPKMLTSKRTALNVLFVGEIRDQQTGELLQDMIQSGCNVFSTVHARNCVGIPARLASPAIGISRDVLATPGNFKLYVYQALLPVTCQHCRLPAASLFENGHIDADALHWRAYFERIERLYGIGNERIFVRNPQGCPHCRRAGLPELNGLKGRSVVAELVEPDDFFNGCVENARVIELTRYVESQRTAAFDDPDMTGKSAMECAIYKMSLGLIDPREIEPRFKAFATVEKELESRQRSACPAPVSLPHLPSSIGLKIAGGKA